MVEETGPGPIPSLVLAAHYDHATSEEKKRKTRLDRNKKIYLSRKRILELLVIKRSGSELKRLLIFSSERERQQLF
jgi:hypothetical protein